MDKAGASKIVKQLLRRKLVERVQIEGDRRSRKLYLTEAGRQWMRAYERARDNWPVKILGEFPEEEMRHAAETLDRLSSTIARHSDSFREPCLQCETYYGEDCRFQKLCGCSCYYQYRWGEKQAILSSEDSVKTATV